jgi:hypothetical protein
MAITPIKADLIADLVGLVNESLGPLLVVRLHACQACTGTGVVGTERAGTATTCPVCGGVGAMECYDLDREKLQTERYGRLIEQFEYKNGQYVPKFRSKDKAFQQLVRMLGYEKAVVEIASAAPLSAMLTDDQKQSYVTQLKELAALGLLDGR